VELSLTEECWIKCFVYYVGVTRLDNCNKQLCHPSYKYVQQLTPSTFEAISSYSVDHPPPSSVLRSMEKNRAIPLFSLRAFEACNRVKPHLVLFPVKLRTLWVTERIILHLGLCHFVEIRSTPGNLCLFNLSISSSNWKAVGSVTSGCALCISVCLISLTPRIINFREKWHLFKVL
jgi:hypothetical protein